MEIKGLITAMVTPFNEDNSINEEATRQLIEKLIKGGVDGIFILGTNGEFHVMNDDEKITFVKLVVSIVNKRVPVYAGAGACGTNQCIELAKRMEAAGADALSVITPYFQTLSDQELIAHYKAVAQSVKCPILLYNIPKCTGNCISDQVVAELCKVDNILGIKDSSGKLELMESYIKVSEGTDFVVLSGSDSLILKALKIGAKGAIAATSNLLTEIDVAIYQNYMKGDLAEAQRAQESIDVLRGVLKLGVQPSIIKKSLAMSGINVGTARAPIAQPSEEDCAKVREMLDFYKM